MCNYTLITHHASLYQSWGSGSGSRLQFRHCTIPASSSPRLVAVITFLFFRLMNLGLPDISKLNRFTYNRRTATGPLPVSRARTEAPDVLLGGRNTAAVRLPISPSYRKRKAYSLTYGDTRTCVLTCEAQGPGSAFSPVHARFGGKSLGD